MLRQIRSVYFTSKNVIHNFNLTESCTVSCEELVLRRHLFYRNICVTATMTKGKIPERWEHYSPVGSIIKGTRFIAFKVPLNQGLNKFLPENVNQFTPEDLTKTISKQGLQLGLVIDLTNTTRYYNKEAIIKQGIAYEKIFTEGHMVPSQNVRNRFFTVVDNFLNENKSNELVIGVHCTHGLNRTGYLVCRYMIDKMNFKADEAIEAFDEARTHHIERENYLKDLRQETATEASSPVERSGHKWTASPSKPEDTKRRHLDEAQGSDVHQRNHYREHDDRKQWQRNTGGYPCHQPSPNCDFYSGYQVDYTSNEIEGPIRHSRTYGRWYEQSSRNQGQSYGSWGQPVPPQDYGQFGRNHAFYDDRNDCRSGPSRRLDDVPWKRRRGHDHHRERRGRGNDRGSNPY